MGDSQIRRESENSKGITAEVIFILHRVFKIPILVAGKT